MPEINHKYELLNDELVKLNIGDYLISSDFKKLLLKYNATEAWRKFYKLGEAERNFVVATDFNHERYDSQNAFIIFLNYIDLSPKLKLFEVIIIDFISSTKRYMNFSELLEALKLTGFNEGFIMNVENTIKTQKQNYKKLEFNTDDKSKINKTELNMQSRRIFIVHGHNEGILQTVARVLEKQNLKPIILKEEPSEGLTIIEKFETNSKSDFAIILLTADDEGNKKGASKLNLRARQNVVFEMGYFFALLGRNKVICLRENGVEVPSDISGRVYINIDENDKWKLSLIKELKHAGFDVTADKL